MPLVSVILPVYNGEKHVRDAIESILSQTFQDFELIIINDGSTDNTKECIKPYLGLSNVIYCYQENKGVASAKNKGYELASGKYIAIQDHDDISLPTRLEEEVAVLESNPDVELVYSPAIFLDDEDHPFFNYGGMRAGYILSREAFYRLYSKGNFIVETSTMFRRRHLNDNETVYMENLRMAEDFEHNLRVAHYFNLYEIGHPLVKMRRGEKHEHLTVEARRAEIFAYYKQVLKTIRLKYKDKEPRITICHTSKSLSNQYFVESEYYLVKRHFTRGFISILKAFIINPLNIGLWEFIWVRIPIFLCKSAISVFK